METASQGHPHEKCPYQPSVGTLSPLLGGVALSVEAREARKDTISAGTRTMRDAARLFSDSINLDPSFENIDRQLINIEETTLPYYMKRDPDTAQYETSRRIRAASLGCISHYFGLTLIKKSFEPGISTEVCESLDPFMLSPYAAVEGFRGRDYHGDEARLATALFAALQPLVEKTIDKLPPGIHYAAHMSSVRLKQEAARLLEKEQRAVSIDPTSDPFIKQGATDTRTHRQRFLEFQANDLPEDPREFLYMNVLSQVEHLVAAIGDLYRQYDNARVPYAEQLPTSMSALTYFRDLARLGNEVGAKIEYDGRYTWKGSVGADRTQSRRVPMFGVEKTPEGIWFAYPQRAPLTSKFLLERFGRCPGQHTVAPSVEQKPLLDSFLTFTTDITGSKRLPKHLLTLGVAEPDIVSSFALQLTHLLLDARLINLTHAEFGRHLGPTQHSDGAVKKIS